MTAGWIGFICGLIIGFAFGIIALALFIAVKLGSNDLDRIFGEVVPPDRPRNTIPPRIPR